MRDHVCGSRPLEIYVARARSLAERYSSEHVMAGRFTTFWRDLSKSATRSTIRTIRPCRQRCPVSQKTRETGLWQHTPNYWPSALLGYRTMACDFFPHAVLANKGIGTK